MLGISKLCRWVVISVAVILSVAGYASNSPMTSAESSLPGVPDGDYGLGLAVANSGLNLMVANPFDEHYVYDWQTVTVRSNYHMGYDLSLMALGDNDQMALRGSNGGVIKQTVGGGLANNSWGLATEHPDSAESELWHGLINQGVLLSNVGEYPDGDNSGDEYRIYYGINIDGGTVADTYQIRLQYNLTAREPKTPTILRVETERCAIGSDCSLNMVGTKLGEIDDIGIDFNWDGQVGSSEKCTDLTIDQDDNDLATCQLPEYSAELTSQDDGGTFEILFTDGEQTVDSGHQLTYYYQPEITGVDAPTMIIKPNMSVVDMASTDTSSLMLADDGTVYLWGDTPLYDLSGHKIFDTAVAPVIVEGFPDVTSVDHLTGIAANGRSYLATSNQGYIYGWGDNSDFRLPIDDNSDWVYKPQQSRYYNLGSDNRQSQMAVLGDGFGVSVDAVRARAKKNMSTWGVNTNGQRGDEHTDIGSKVVNDVSDGSYPLNADKDEKFVQVAAGAAHAIATTNAGRVFTWGAFGGNDGRLGFNTNSDAVRPHDITKPDSGDDYLSELYHDEHRRFIQVAAGDNFSVALAVDEITDQTFLYAFGANDYGQLGVGGLAKNGANLVMQSKSSTERIVGITASGKSVAAWTSDGRLYAWGDNSGGKLGIAGGEVINKPTQILGEYQITDVALGRTNYVVTTDNRILAWGGQTLGIVDITNQLTHPAYLIKITGKHLDRADLGVDFNNNGAIDSGEKPLARSCTANGCYLLVSTASMTNPGNYQIIATTVYGGRAEWSGVKGQIDNGRHIVSKRVDVPLISIIDDEIVSDESEANGAQASDENPDDTIDKVNNTENTSTKSDDQNDVDDDGSDGDDGDDGDGDDGDDVVIADDNNNDAKDDSQPDNSSDANGVGDVSSDANESSDSIESSADLGGVVSRPDSPSIQPVNGQIESVFDGAGGVNVDNQSQLSILINDG